MKPWEAFGVEVEKQPPPLKYNRYFVMIVVILNFFAVAAASQGSWGAFAIMFYIVPIMNMVMATLSVLLIPILREDNPSLSIWRHLLVSLGVPTAAVVLDYLIIAWMDVPGGC